MKYLGLIVVSLALLPVPARAEIRPLTSQELDALSWSSTSPDTIKALITRNVLDAAAVATEIDHEIRKEAKQYPAWLAFELLVESMSAPIWCKDAATAFSLVQKNAQIDIARQNIVQLKNLLYQKDESAYHAFLREPVMRAWDYRGDRPLRPKTACGQSAPPSAQNECGPGTYPALRTHDGWVWCRRDHGWVRR